MTEPTDVGTAGDRAAQTPNRPAENATVSSLTRTFTEADQRWFCDVTGDENPIHADANWAAVNFPGHLVVHGVHVLLWALDCHVGRLDGMRVRGVRATFLKPILVGDEVDAESAGDRFSLRVLVRGEPVVVIHLHHEIAAPRVPSGTPLANPFGAARDRSGERLTGLAGAIALPDRRREIMDLFPALATAAGPPALSGLAALSNLVGMECPGLHSMLSELCVSITQADPADHLSFRVTRYDAPFKRVEMDVSGYGVAGTVAAFAGGATPSSPSDDEIRSLISVDDFAGQRPLVIGGSSGLGALTTRLLVAGGAQPTVTWCRSRAAAAEVATAAAALGGRCDLVQLDARRPAAGLAALAAADWTGGQLYYFASPRIFRRRLELYQSQDLQDFLSVYVNGFYEIVRGLMKMRRSGPLAVFYPSSVAVADPASDLLEYKTAKLLGEDLCARLQRRYRSLTTVVVRLPRTSTRQTRTFLNVASETPERVMVPIVKTLQGQGGSTMAS